MTSSGAPDFNDETLIARAADQVRAIRARDGDRNHLAGARLAAIDESVEPPALLSPDSIPGYDILGERHRGGQGAVFEAIHTATGRRVAIKVTHALPTSTAGLARFELETRIMAQLRHPHIVTIHDSAVLNGRGYYVMEFVDGAPLDQWAQARLTQPPPATPFTPRDIAALFATISHAVQAAHVLGVIHRDLKPSNVLIDESGAPRIVDFGLAKRLGPAADGSEAVGMTQTGQFVGSLPWSSPEQVGGAEPVDTRSDVYALGVMLYQALTTEFPYPVAVPIATAIENIRARAPTPPSRLSRGVDEDLETIVLKCLQKEPDRRYQTAGELARDLDRYLGGEPLEARRDSAAYMLRKTIRRYRWPLAVGASFVVLLAGSAVATTLLWRQASRDRDLAVQAERNEREARQRAEAAEANASKRFAQVRELAHAFMFDMHDLIRPLPGSTKAREFLVQTGLHYLDELGSVAADDIDLQREIARGHDRLGDVQGSQHVGGGHLGDPAGALASYQKARAFWEAVVLAEPENAETLRELSDSQQRMGHVLFDLGRLDEAIAQYEAARALALQLLEMEPGNTTHQALVAATEERIGNVYAEQGRWPDAIARYEAMLAAREALMARTPDDADLERGFTVALEKVGNARRAIGDNEGALALYRRSLAIRETMAGRDRSQAQPRRDLMVSYGKVADVLLQQGKFEEGARLHARALAIAQELAQVDPENVQAQRDLAVCFEKMGDACMFRDDLSGALEQYEQRLRQTEALMRVDPESVVSQEGMVIAWFKVATAEATLAEDAAAPVAKRRSRLERARELFQRAHDRYLELIEAGRVPESRRAVLSEPLNAVQRCDAALAQLGTDSP